MSDKGQCNKCIVLWSVFLAMVTPRVHAEITLDGTLGPAGPLQGPDHLISADLGRQSGNNLFHSFGRFNINTGESATFTGPNTLDNVIGRVTGGANSTIDGLLRSTIPGADLYLLNPAGVVFKDNARLDMSGSFHLSTADHLHFADGGRFDATQPDNTVLTSAPPSAFGFLGNNTAAISTTGSTLEVTDGQALTLVGGDLTITGGVLAAPGGQVQLASTASPGKVALTEAGLKTDSLSRLGAIRVADSAALDVSSSGGGQVRIRGGQFVMEQEASIKANTQGDAEGNSVAVDIQVRDGLIVDEQAEIRADLEGAANSGDLLLDAGQVRVTGGAQIGINNSGSGRGGDLRVKAKQIFITGESSALFNINSAPGDGDAGVTELQAEQLTVTDGGSIDTESRSAGRGSDLTVTAEAVSIAGEIPTPDGSFQSGIYSKAQGTGDGGNTVLKLGQLRLSNGGTVTMASQSPGKGGDLTVNAETVAITGAGRVSGFGSSIYSEVLAGISGEVTLTGGELILADGGIITTVAKENTVQGGNLDISADSVFVSGSGSTIANDASGEGDAGDTTLQVGKLSLTEGGVLFTNTLSAWKGGNLNISADSLFVSGSGSTIANVASGEGNAGDTTLQVGELSFTGGGFLTTETKGAGKGGNLTITADSVTVSGDDGRDQISKISNITTSDGAAGTTTLEVDQLALVDGGQIFTASGEGAGRGGDLTITADSISISGATSELAVADINFRFPSSIFTGTGGQGDGGNIQIAAKQLGSNGGFISTETTTEATGNAGNISIHVSDTLRSDNGSIRTSSSQSVGGNIQITGGNILLLNDSDIKTNVRSGAGGGGNITITGPVLVALEDSDLEASADQGFGGNIILNTDLLLRSPDVDFDASSNVEGREGRVDINSIVGDITAKLVVLPVSFYDAAGLLSSHCGARTAGTESSLVVGRDSLPPDPAALLPTYWSDRAVVPTESNRGGSGKTDSASTTAQNLLVLEPSCNSIPR